MFRQLKIYVLISLAAGCLGLPAHAQYVGPTTYSGTRTVLEVLKNPVDDQYVRLQGQLMRKVGRQAYIFSDGTGDIIVEIASTRFPDREIDEHTQVEIEGEVDTSAHHPPEIDVDILRIIE